MLYSLTESEIQNRIEKRDVKIGFVGLGRIGLPLAATLAQKGFRVLGVDIKNDIVNKINTGTNPYVDELGLTELINEVISDNKLKATNQISETKDCDLIIISVPTLVENGEPQIEAVKIVAKQVAQNFLRGKTIVVQSTVPPLTTKNILQKVIEDETRLRAGQDFGLAYSPERTQSPQVLQDLRNYPKVVGAIDKKSSLIISQIYGTFAPSIIGMGSIVAAELEKLVENTYRDVNIAFANELAQVCELYGVDVYGITKAANSQPYSHILNPGLVGGHCIPVVPYFIISEAKKRGLTPHLMEIARDVNNPFLKKYLA